MLKFQMLQISFFSILKCFGNKNVLYIRTRGLQPQMSKIYRLHYSNLYLHPGEQRWNYFPLHKTKRFAFAKIDCKVRASDRAFHIT